MKRIVILIITNLCLIGSYGQIAVEDAKGQSSILYRNSNIRFDITEATISASIDNFRKIHVAERPDQLLWQLAVTGKNEEGMATLWGDGNLTPSSRLEGFLGYRFRGYKQEYILYRRLDELSNSNDRKRYLEAGQYLGEANGLISKNRELRPSQKAELKNNLLKFSNSEHFSIPEVIQDLDNLQKGYSKNSETQLASATSSIKELLQRRQGVMTELKDKVDEVKAQMDEINDKLDKYKFKRRAFTVFLNYGMNASSFKLYSNPAVLPFSDRFEDNDFRGGFLNLGFNYDFGARWVIGVTTGYEKANTFDSLSKKEFTERTTETNNNQQFNSERKYTGYSGFYKVYDRIPLKTDLLYFGVVSEDLRFVWNVLFSRWFIPVNSREVKGVGNVGTGINFFKKEGKFAGGVYLQGNDIFNKVSQEADFFKRISIGVTAKLAFEAIFER